MNGKTDIDPILNPASAEMDRRTYGWESLNFCVYGHRLIKFHIGWLTVDIYRGTSKPFIARNGGANGTARYKTIFWQGGKITWRTHNAHHAQGDKP